MTTELDLEKAPTDVSDRATGICFGPFFHVWTKWKDIASGPLTSDGAQIGEYITQERRCIKCNRVHLREAQSA